MNMPKLVYYGELRDLTHLREEHSDADSMNMLMRDIAFRHGAPAAKAARRCTITLDGVRVDRPNSRQPIPKDSEICFFPLCSGG